MRECEISESVANFFHFADDQSCHSAKGMMRGLQFIIIIITFFQLILSHSPKFDYESLSTSPVKSQSSISQTALTECHLQIECTAPQQHQSSRRNGNESSPTVRKIRIPVRAARGPQGPRGLRGPAGPRGPPGFNPEISDDVVASKLFII